MYPLEYPSGLGSEGAGDVLAVGEGVNDINPGDRVAYCTPPVGAYAEERVYPADRLVPLPGEVSYEQAAAMMLKGLTSWYLLHHSYPVQDGDTVLLYAAAGGVGQIAARWAALLGARVIGVVGSSDKVEAARNAGCAEVVLGDDPDFVEKVRKLSGGGVAAVYDSLGKDSFMQSLDCLRPLGTMVTFGNATGLVEPIAPIELARRGSLKTHAADSVRLRLYSGETARCRGDPVRTGGLRRALDSDRAALCSAGCRTSTPRCRGAPHHGLDNPSALTRETLGPRASSPH